MRKSREQLFKEAKDRILADEAHADDVTKELIGYYEKTANDIEDRIHAIYSKFAVDNQLTPAQVNQYLKNDEFVTWRKSVKEYLKDIANEGAESKTLIELNTLSAKARLTRQEKLLADIYRDMADMAKITRDKLEPALEDILKTSYYHSAYNVQMGMGVGFKIGDLTDNAVREALNYPWAKKTFSKAIWDNVDNINGHIKATITKGFMSGKSIQKMTRELKDITGKGQYAVERLIRTECKMFANLGELEGYKANGIERYVFMGAVEHGISCSCGFFNNKTIATADAEPYLNFPPLHPNCKCTVRAYFDDSILDNNKDTRPIEELSLDEWQREFIDKKAHIALENDELHAINRYISSDAYFINEKLRRGKRLNKKEKQLITQLDSALDKMPDYKGAVYRSITINDDDLEDFLKNHEVGKLKMTPAYISSSTEIYDDSFNVQYVIQSKHGKDIRKYNQNEKEILFKRNTGFYVTKVDGNHIYMEEADADG